MRSTTRSKRAEAGRLALFAAPSRTRWLHDRSDRCADVGNHVDILRGISDSWLKSRSAREKSFSVAAFSEAYLAAQSVMLVRENGVPVAFTTFMTTDMNVEATVGVMRHVAEASPYVMDYLFVQLALHLKQDRFVI